MNLSWKFSPLQKLSPPGSKLQKFLIFWIKKYLLKWNLLKLKSPNNFTECPSSPVLQILREQLSCIQFISHLCYFTYLKYPLLSAFISLWTALTFSVSIHKPLVNTEQNWSQDQSLSDLNSDSSPFWKVTITSDPLLPSLYQISISKRNILQVLWQFSWLFWKSINVLWIPFILLLICTIIQQVSEAALPDSDGA